MEDNQGKETGTLVSHTKEIVFGSGIALFGMIVGKVLIFLMHIVLSRVLKPRAYGLYALASSVTLLVTTVASLGLPKGVLRYGVIFRSDGDDSRLRGLVHSALFVTFVAGIIVQLVLMISANTWARSFFSEPQVSPLLRIFALSIPFYLFVGIAAFFALVYRQILYQQTLQNIAIPLLNLVLVVLCLSVGWGVEGAVLAYLITGIAGAILGILMMNKLFPPLFQWRPVQYQTRELVSYSAPLLFIHIWYLLITNLDRLMLGFYYNADEVGKYTVASATALHLSFVANAFITIFAPIVSELHHQQQSDELRRVFRVVNKWVFSFTMILFLIVTIFSAPVLMIFGPEYSESRLPLLILAFGVLVSAGGGPVGMFLHMTGKQNLDFVNGMIVAIINIALNMLLIPHMKMVGAAVATTVSLILLHVIRVGQITKIFGFFPYDLRIIKVLIAACIAFIIGFLCLGYWETLPWYLILLFGSIAVTGIYTLVILLLKLDAEDMFILSAIARKIR